MLHGSAFRYGTIAVNKRSKWGVRTKVQGIRLIGRAVPDDGGVKRQSSGSRRSAEPEDDHGTRMLGLISRHVIEVTAWQQILITRALARARTRASAPTVSAALLMLEIELILSSFSNVNNEILVKSLNNGFEGTFTKDCSRNPKTFCYLWICKATRNAPNCV